MDALFVYGTLMYPEVVEALLGRVPKMEPATVTGFARFAVRGQVFPAAVPGGNQPLEGKLMRGLTESELRILDAFEGEEYANIVVTAQPGEGGEAVEATLYQWRQDRGPPDALTDQSWDPEAFPQHLPSYTTMCRAFLKDLDVPWKQWA